MFYLSDVYNINFEKSRVKSYIRKGRIVKSHDRKKKPITKVLLSSAATLGLTTGTYLLLKNRYKKGIGESAKIALKEANKINVPDINTNKLQKNNINFTIGGLWYNKETRKSTDIASYIEKKFKGFTVPVDTDSFNDLPYKVPKNNIQVVLDMKLTGIRNAFIKGYNPTARELAAQMYAYHKKYPTHTMVAYGHSSGGTITNEAMLILEKMGVDKSKFKQVTFGANNYGILPSYKNSLHIVDTNDWQANPFSFPNKTTIGDKNKIKKSKTLGEKLIEDHGIYHYVSSSESKKLIDNFIKPPLNWKPPETIKEVKKEQIKETELQKSIRLLRDLRKKYNNSKKSYDKAINNNSIPEDKRKTVIEQAKKKVDNAQKEYETRRRKTKEIITNLRKEKRSN